MKIITATARDLDDPNQEMFVTLENGAERVVFTWDRSRLTFWPAEVMGKTVEEAQEYAKKKANVMFQDDAVQFGDSCEKE